MKETSNGSPTHGVYTTPMRALKEKKTAPRWKGWVFVRHYTLPNENLPLFTSILLYRSNTRNSATIHPDARISETMIADIANIDLINKKRIKIDHS